MSERIDIDRLARECGPQIERLGGCGTPPETYYTFDTKELTAYTRAVMEECAKVCDAEANIEGIAQKCSAAIREMMP